MSWTGRSSLVCLVAVFAIAFTALLPGVARASNLQGETPLYYPSFPLPGGPYILDATYDAEDGVVRVVFNEEIDPLTVSIDDFVFSGFDATTATPEVGNRVVTLGTLTGGVSAGADSVWLADIGVIDDAAGDYANTDVDHVALVTGPVMVYAEIANWYDFDPSNDAITAYFDANIAFNATPFSETPELTSAGFTLTVVGDHVTITQNAGNFRSMWPGISKLWLRAGGARWSDDSVANLAAQKRMLENEDGGPILISAYYNGTVNVVWLIFSEAVNPASFGPPSAQYVVDGGSFSITASQDLAFPGEFTNCVLVSDEDFVPGANTVQVEAANLLEDYQNEPGPQTAPRAITAGTGLIRVTYDDGGTETLVDDHLEAWFSEEFLDPGVVDGSDFHIDNLTDAVFDYLTILATNESGLGHVVFSAWQVADENLVALDGRLPVGHRFYIDAESDINGAQTNSGVDSNARMPILEDYTPSVNLTEVTTWTNKIYDAGPPVVDVAYLAWAEQQVKESGIPDTGDEYFLFSTWNDPAAFNQGFITTFAENAVVVADVGNGLLDPGVNRAGVSIASGAFTTSDGHAVLDGEMVYFMLVPCTYWGEMGSFEQALVFTRPFVVGPVCPPVDFDAVDDNLIHVTAVYDAGIENWIRSVTGDASSAGGAAPCGEILYVMDGVDPLTANVLGSGPIAADGSFGPIALTADANDLEFIYLFAWEDGTYSAATQIFNDITPPTLALLNGDGQIDIDGDGDADGDLFDPYRIYKADDYVNIITRGDDQVDWTAGPGGVLPARSDLLSLSSDFSLVDETAGSDAVGMVSMGADEIDNDGDWNDTSADPTLNGNGTMEFPEPYFDENGDGNFDPGETFVDKDDDDLCDCLGGSDDEFDFFLDSADGNEHGFYEIQLDPDAYNDVTKGYRLDNPVTDPNGIDNFAEIFDLPVGISITEVDLEVTTTLNGDNAPFHLELDEAEPSVIRLSNLYSLESYTDAPAPDDDIFLPTDPVYHLGRYMSFTYGLPSDYDVLFGTTEIDPGTGTYERLTLDPPGPNPDDGAPGILEFDDDRDGALTVLPVGQQNNGVDDDEDGVIDNEGEGTDFQDAQVVDASQDQAADAAAPGGDGIYVTTDHRDNDNDAFYVFEPYFDPDLVNHRYAKIVWYNIDETRSNGIDDDNDAVVDETDGSEDETYDPLADDNEDGIVDGEAIAVTVNGNRMVAIFDDTFVGNIRVDASYVEGAARPLAGPNPNGDNDLRGMTEVVDPAMGTLDPNKVLSDPFPDLPFGDTLSTQVFDWNAFHMTGAIHTNLDLWQIAQLYGLEADGEDHGYRFRALAYDQPGNVNASYSVPFTWTLDTTPPGLSLEDCTGGTEDDPSLVGPPSFMAGDVRPADPGVQIYNSGTFTLTTEDGGTAANAQFDYRTSDDNGVTWSGWASLGNDPSRPFTADFDASTITITNDPPDAFVLVQFRAYGCDEFDNCDDPADACVFQVQVIDGEPGIVWFTLIDNVPNGSPDPMPVFWYRDEYGPVQVPVGPAIDIWADYDDLDGDPATNDIVRAVFEVRRAGEGNEWTPFATQTGDISIDPITGEHTVDFTKPVAVTLDTEELVSTFGTGSFDIRVYVCDIEGNCNILTADIAMITIVEEGLRAYIQEPVVTAPLEFDLFAINFIHDYFIDYVTFEYFVDLNGDGLDDAEDRTNGSSWITIDVDNAGSGRGDIVLYHGTRLIQNLFGRVAMRPLGAPLGEGFVDFDNDGYSDRDPMVRDVNGDGILDDGDVVVVGDRDELTTGMALTDFAADEFHTGVGLFEASDWIFKENGLGASGTLDLWEVQWDATGLEGEVLVRAVATDETGATDDDGGVTVPSVIPMVSITLDTVPPVATITEYQLPDGTDIDATTPDIYIDGSLGWMQIDATTFDTDVANVLFQVSTDGGATWTDLDVNDDNDFYANIDGMPGLGPEDEVILDVNGDFVYDAGDDVLYAGENGVVDTPIGTPLIPLIGEDPPGGGDQDHDGMVDEDGATEPEDDAAPYFVQYIWPSFVSDTNVLFRAVAEDESGNIDPAPVAFGVIIGESTPPETDIVEVFDAEGNPVDVKPEIVDGTGTTLLSGGMLVVHATAEDASAIDHVDLMWRFAATCYDFEPWENPWRSMADPAYNFAPSDDAYPYIWDENAADSPGGVNLDAMTAMFGEAVFEIYANAVDENGNQTPPWENPYVLRIMNANETAEITTPTDGVTVAPGDEFWFEAQINPTPVDPLTEPAVVFYFAERVVDEAVDATRITPDPDNEFYMSLPTEYELVDPGSNAVLTIDAVAIPYYDDLSTVPEATEQAWSWHNTVVGTGHIEFLVEPSTTAVILVSYDQTAYMEIGTDYFHTVDADGNWIYTQAWSAESGGVPAPLPGVDAYDVIAVVVYNPDDASCEVSEPLATEFAFLTLVNEDAPDVTLYPYGLHNADHLEYYPGNPSFDSEAGLTEWKMSGIEHEFFAVAEDPAGDEITGANLVFTHGTDVTTVPMTLIDEPAQNVMMTFTLYESDFPEVPYAFENVVLQLGGIDYPTAEVTPGIWQVTDVPVPVDAATQYSFFIDMDGDNYMTVVDPRNWGAGKAPDAAESWVNVPPTPFWFAEGIDFGDLTTVWQVQATATDPDGNVGVDGPLTFVYDPVAPTVDALQANSLRFSSDFEVEVHALVTDPTPPDFNAITVDSVIVQYSPNYVTTDQLEAVVWLPFGNDTDPDDGWIVTGYIPDPEEDGYDNDHDGLWDEPDEATSQMAFRALAVDDGNNVGAPTVLPFILDDTPPMAEMTSPAEGSAFAYGTVIDVSAEITDTEEDVAYVLFQYNVGDGWEDIDITPEDDSDNPWDTTPPYAVQFDTAQYLTEEDLYVRFRAVPVDMSGNEGTSNEVLVVVDDITGPTAYIMTATTTGGFPMPITDPQTAVTGTDVGLDGVAVDPSGVENLATVTVEYYNTETEAWTPIDVLTDFTETGPTSVTWALTGWDVTGFADGTVLDLRAIATDIDGNTGGEAIPVSLRIDHTAPSVFYQAIEPGFAGFVPWKPYQNNGVPLSEGRAITPDAETGDLAFAVVTPDADVSSIVLQWRYPDDPIGDWSEWEFTGDMFDLETNLTFTAEGVTYYYWRLYIDNFADQVDISGEVELRALATDHAGNANILHNLTPPAANPWEAWTIDTDDPTTLDFHNNLTDNNVASGDPVELTVVATDATTDIAVVRFEYRSNGEWLVIDPNPATPEIEVVEPIIAENIDTPYAQWTASVTWITPLVYWDTAFPVRAVFYDTAGNEGATNDTEQWLMTVTVEDNTAPAGTKLVAIAPDVAWVDAIEDFKGPYSDDCEGGTLSGLFVDEDHDGFYDAGTDLAIDYGQDGDVLVNGAHEGGESDGLAWPAFIDETMLDNHLDLYVGETVVLIGRSQINDIGLRQVEFYAVPAEGEQILIGIDECPPLYGATYFWQIFWNTLEVDIHGNPMYPDGQYGLVAIAEDLEGNREPLVLTGLPVVNVDNSAPEATVDADATTPGVQTAADVQRNDPFQLYATTTSDREDDGVRFWVKRSRDLNMTESYTTGWPPITGYGVDDSDVNPDMTRPFVFDWNLTTINPPLPVGESFDVVATGIDFLGNEEDPVAVHDAGRFITMTIFDTQGPVPTITYVQRATGDTDWIAFPSDMPSVHARDIAQMCAALLDSDTDVQRVEFMFRPEGVTEPTLIDADIVPPDEDFYACIGTWDLAAMAEGTYFVWARGWDDVGNFADGPTFTLVVDRTAPTFNIVSNPPTIITPVDGMIECPHFNDVTDVTYYDLVFSTTDPDVWIDGIVWEEKAADIADEFYEEIDTDILFDAGTGAYAGIWDLHNYGSFLYDVRLTVTDLAGNETQVVVARNVVVDVTDPTVAVTRIVVGGEDVYPTEPVEISTGDVITLCATASDDEEYIPDDFETGVTEMIFEARRLPGGDWFELGLWTAPEGTLFTEVSHCIDWNTTGLGIGDYEVRAFAADAECNEEPSGAVTVYIRDIQPPRARIAGFQAWHELHGDNPENMVDIYAQAYCDTEIEQVQFQYSLNGTDWIPIGITTDIGGEGAPEEFCDLWFTTMALDQFGVGAEFTLRAIASDTEGNQDPEPPTLAVEVIEIETFGTLDLLPTTDFGIVESINLSALAGSEECGMLVEVTMTDATQTPQVIAVQPDIEDDVPVSYAECVEMSRSVDDPLLWRGVFYMEDDDCGATTVFATALSDGQIDLQSMPFTSFQVTSELGTNGVVTANGYIADVPDTTYYLHATAEIPPGSWMSDACLLVAPGLRPQLNDSEVFYLSPLDRTAYHIGLICEYDYPEEGFLMTASIEYDDAALDAAMEAAGIPVEERAAKEAFLTVRRFDDYYVEGWTSEYIQQISVDVEANRVTFVVSDLDYDANIYALFVPTINGPITVQTFDPSSPYAGRWNYTDHAPVIVINLNSEAGNDYDSIDEHTIELWIDGNLVATDEWVQGADLGGDFLIEAKNDNASMYQLTYTHANDRRYWLAEGEHTLNVRFKNYDDEDYAWNSLPPSAPGATFFVDATPPVVQLYSGFADNPALHNDNAYSLNGYLNPDNANEMLTVYLYDGGSGVLVRPDDLHGEEDILGVKYDLWLVQNEDDQNDIDEYEERMLLHTGTADEILPYLNPPLVSGSPEVPVYTPADTLFMPLPIVAGGHGIHDGDILELVMYTKKHVEPDWTIGCDGSLIIEPDLLDGSDPDTLGTIFVDCYVDSLNSLHVYEQGILDWAGNAGSEFVEARFVVDMSAPEVILVTPAGGIVRPNEPFCFEAQIFDEGSGVESASVILVNSEGTEIPLTDVVVTDETVTGCVEGGLPAGTYTLLVTVTDKAGNTETVAITITVESPFLAVTNAHVYPNPFNPSIEAAMIIFNVSRTSDVTIEAFDFAGESVGDIWYGPCGTDGAGDCAIPWNGQTAAGGALANGAYMLRIKATDGLLNKTETVKVVIWRE